MVTGKPKHFSYGTPVVQPERGTRRAVLQLQSTAAYILLERNETNEPEKQESYWLLLKWNCFWKDRQLPIASSFGHKTKAPQERAGRILLNRIQKATLLLRRN